jgi:Flp pilus assembly protein protease CpaA
MTGAGFTLALLLPVLALGWIRAGDLLAAMVLGGLWGFQVLPGLALWSCAAGLALAMGLAALRTRDLRRRSADERDRACVIRRPPLTVAAGLGATALQLWGVPW